MRTRIARPTTRSVSGENSCRIWESESRRSSRRRKGSEVLMSRLLACLAVVAVIAPARGQSTAPLGEPLSLQAGPAPVPTPSLRYRLVPDQADLLPGNAAALVYRSEALLVQ